MCWEIMTTYCSNDMEYINVICKQMQVFSVKPNGSYDII
jgi:hypothetical protein